MKLNMIRLEHGPMDGVLVPADDVSINRVKKLSHSQVYKVDVSEPQNIALHRKLFKVIGFAFDHMTFDDTPAQRERFRNDLTILAGYFHKVYNYKGELRVVAKSLNFNKMSPDERREFYDAVLNVIWEKIFKSSDLTILAELNRF